MAVIDIKDRREKKVAVEAPPFSEEAIALFFAEKYCGELRYVAKWGTWMRYRGTRWEVDETYDIFSLVRKLCREVALIVNDVKVAKAIASAKTVAAVEHLARSDRRIAATVNQWDADPWLLNTPAGVVDLHTGKMRKHEAEDYLTKITAIAPKGKCPRFTKFLKRIFDGDMPMTKYMQRVLGYGLTGKTNEHALFFCYGTGANGKGVLFNTTRGIWGSYHQTAALTTFTASRNEQHPTELAMLRGARLVTCTETEEGARWAETKIKTLTGGDAIMARFMRQDFFEVIPAFKLMISGNHKPALRSVNEAMRRRMNLLPFAVTIPEAERDLDLTEKLEKEWSGILAWAIKGCVLWQKHGLAPPPAVIAATEEYFADEDTLGRFLEEICECGANYDIGSEFLFSQWKDWAVDNNAWVGSAKIFGGWMAERGFAKTVVRDEHGGQKRAFKGLRKRYGQPPPDPNETKPSSDDPKAAEKAAEREVKLYHLKEAGRKMASGNGCFGPTDGRVEAATKWLNDKMPSWPNEIEAVKIIVAAQRQDISLPLLDVAVRRLSVKRREENNRVFWRRDGTKVKWQ